MLYAMQGEGADADRLRAMLAQPISDDGEVAEALRMLREGPGLAQARTVLAEHADAARAELAKLPDCPATEALASLTSYVIDRTG